MSVPRRAATFGRLLREHRIAAGLTQEALTERSGVSPRTIQQLEADEVRPRQSTATALADAFALSTSDREALLATATRAPRQPRERRMSRSVPLHPAIATVEVTPEDLAEPGATLQRSLPDRALLALPRPTPTNVPWPITTILGRETELATIHDLIVMERKRLITLTGVGGSGKTRLAIQVATGLLDSFPDGVWLAELAAIGSPLLVPDAVARAVGVLNISGGAVIDALVDYLGGKRALLVLDNCEHLIDSCAELAERLLAVCPSLHVLATSREPLRIAGERRVPVRPLAIPTLDGIASFDALSEMASVRLFVDRARDVDAELVLTETNAPVVGQVCARLDGIPLAIELAASRVGVLSVEQIATRLEAGFRLLSSGSRSAPTRQQTMRATLDWSYDLLTHAEQAIFRTLSVFAGGFDLEAVEAIASDGPGVSGDTGVESAFSPDTLDVLALLVDKSLVVAEHTLDRRRYRLLEPVRQYADQLLQASGETAAARERHARYFASLAEGAAPWLRGPQQIGWLNRLERERDNLRATLGWVEEHGSVDDGLRLAIAMTPYWEARGYLREGRRWAESMLATASPDNATPALRMRALMAAGLLMQWQVDLASAEPLLTDALTAARELGDRRSEAEAVAWLSAVRWQENATERAVELGEAAIRLGEEVGDDWVVGFALLNIGVSLRFGEDARRSVGVLERSLSRFRKLGDLRYIAIVVTMLGLSNLELGEYDRAERLFDEALRELRVTGDPRFTIFALRGLADLAHVHGSPHRAAQLFGASEALRESVGFRHAARNVAKGQRLLDALREQISAAEVDAAYASGREICLEQVFTELVDMMEATE